MDCAARASVSRRRVGREFEREHVQNFWQPIIASCNAMIRSSWRPYSLPVYVLRTAHGGEGMLPSFGAFLLALMVCVGVSFAEAWCCGHGASWEDF